MGHCDCEGDSKSRFSPGVWTISRCLKKVTGGAEPCKSLWNLRCPCRVRSLSLQEIVAPSMKLLALDSATAYYLNSARLAPAWKEGSDMNPIRLPPFSRLPCASCTDVFRIT